MHKHRLLLLLTLFGAAGAGCLAALHPWRGGGVAATGGWVQVKTESVEQAIVAEGPLEPGSVVNVTAPSDGIIMKRWVQPGDSVEKGASLLQLEVAKVQAEMREAEAAKIRAEEELADVVTWPSSVTMRAAQRQVATAQNQVLATKGRFNDAQLLFDKGIIARSELDSARAEVSGAAEQLHSANDGLTSAMRKGSEAQQRIARLDVALRRQRLQGLQDQLAHAVLKAPSGGVVLKPVLPEGASPPKPLDVGSAVALRDLLLTIGDTTTYAVHAALDEIDSARVKPGMTVEVTSGTDTSVTLRGVLKRVSAQARRDPNLGGAAAPTFEIEILISEVPQALRPRLRLGMTTRLRIRVDQEPNVLTVPLASVKTNGAGQSSVIRKAASVGANSPGQEVIVQPGFTLSDRVVVLTGLAASDLVWAPAGALPAKAALSAGPLTSMATTANVR